MNRMMKIIAGGLVLSAAATYADGLPEGYTQLPFLKAAGQCQVKTGLTPASNDVAVLTFELSTVSGNQNLWCSRNDGDDSFSAFMIGDKVRLDRDTTQVTSTDGLAAGTKYTLTANYGTGRGEVTDSSGVPVTALADLGTDEYNPGTVICLFASHTTGPDTGLNNYGSWTFYSFTLTDAEGGLRCSLVPARRASDGVLGLYDTVRGEFLVNGLSGSLTLGDGYSFDENGNLLISISANVTGNGTVRAGDGEAASTATGYVEYEAALAGTQSATFTAVPGEGLAFYWVLGEGVTLTSGTIYDETIGVTATKPGGVVTAKFYSLSGDKYAKLIDGSFHYFSDAACSVEIPSHLAPQSVEGLVVLFANDAEYQALVPYTNELATAFGGVPYLQNDLTLTADADWRAMDFNINGKTIVLKGWDLYVRKPLGEGRITSGNLINQTSFSTAYGAWHAGGGWYGFAGSKANSYGNKDVYQSFTVPKARDVYLQFRVHSWNNSGYNQYVSAGIDSVNNLVKDYQSGTGSSPSSYYRTTDIYTRTGLAAGSTHQLQFTNAGGYTYAGDIYLCPTSLLIFDIPENEEYFLSGISLGGASDVDFSGIGLHVHKTGKGLLTMSKVNTRFGSSGKTSVVVEEGLVKKGAGATCGASGSTVQVDDGGRFELCGAESSVAYDFNLAGSGTDGLGALVNNTELTGADVPSFPVRNVSLSADAVIGGSQPFSLKHGNWTATTTTLNGFTLTYTNATVYAGNVTYNNGSVMIPGGTEFVFLGHNSSAPSANVTISGRLVMDNGGFTTIRGLVFEEGAQLVLSDTAASGTIPTPTITGKYAPAIDCVTNGTCTLTVLPVQLGDASHTEPELDLSRLSGAYDGTNVTFQGGSTVTVNLGEREFNGSELLVAWTELSTATFVVDEENKERLGLLPRPNGLYIFPGRVPSFVKYDAANNCWKFFDEDVNPYVGEWTLGMDYMKALFANDAEFQALVPHTNVLAEANVQVLMQNDITLTADADWSGMDFDMNGKTVTLRGYDLKVHKPQGSGRITAGNILNPDGYSFASGAYYDGTWLYLGGGNGSVSARQNFTLPKARTCYFKTQTKYTYTGYAQYVSAGINSKDNLMGKTTALSGTQPWGPYIKTGLSANVSYQLQIARYSGKTRMSRYATISPQSHLIFDIPEGEEHNPSNITLGGSTPGTSDYGGLGLQVRKVGKGTLVMSKVNDFGGNGITSMVVEEGLVKKGSGATCGAQYSRITVEDGAQFDLCGRTYHDYDYTLAGSGPDGTGALTSSTQLDAATAYAQNTGTSFLRHVSLSSNATVYAANNMGMIFYNNSANTMTMNGHTVTYDGVEEVEEVEEEVIGKGVGAYRTFLGNMSYSGAGRIVVAKHGWIQPHISSPSATDTEVEVYGRFWMNSGRLTPVKALVFKEGSLFREMNANPGTTVVNGTYGPNVLTESESGYLTHPKVQLGDASHLNATLDLSQWTTTFDDREEGSLSFYAGTEASPMTVALDIGERTAGVFGYAYYWKEKPPETVKFVRSENMVRRGVKFTARDAGLHFENGLILYIR